MTKGQSMHMEVDVDGLSSPVIGAEVSQEALDDLGVGYIDEIKAIIQDTLREEQGHVSIETTNGWTMIPLRRVITVRIVEVPS